jgi:hypothetical protein
MRATTIRFTPDLWEMLQREAGKEGVSVAQYVRDAALFRVAYGAGVRREHEQAMGGSDIGSDIAPSRLTR